MSTDDDRPRYVAVTIPEPALDEVLAIAERHETDGLEIETPAERDPNEPPYRSE